MTVETTPEEFVLRLPRNMPKDRVQEIIDFAIYQEITSKFKVTQDVADELSEELKETWWEENKEAFRK